MLVHAYIIILLSETLHTRGRWNDGEKEKRFARTPTDARAQKSLLSLKYNNIVCKDCGSCVTGTDGEVQYKRTVPIHTMRRARVSSEAISKYTHTRATCSHTRHSLYSYISRPVVERHGRHFSTRSSCHACLNHGNTTNLRLLRNKDMILLSYNTVGKIFPLEHRLHPKTRQKTQHPFVPGLPGLIQRNW